MRRPQPGLSSVVAVAVLALSLTFVGTAPSQGVSAVVAPNPAPPGSQITVTVTVYKASGIQALLNPSGQPCIAGTFHTGGPNGTLTFCGGFLTFCGPNTMFLPQCATFSQTLTACNTPGDYWIRVNYKDATGSNFIDEWAPFTVAGATSATLSNLTAPMVGNVLDLMLTDTAANAPGAAYVTVASLTANTGIGSFPPLFICTDQDVLFDLSFPVPFPPLFVNFQGALDLNGQALMSFVIPNVPQLSCLPLHFQSVVIPPAGAARTSNCLGFTVQ